MPKHIKQEYCGIRNEVKGPKWQFAGLVILIALVVLSAYVSTKTGKRESEFIVSPRVGDIYEYESQIGIYSTLKVTGVTNDSVFVSPNDYETSELSMINNINKPEYYSRLSLVISRNRLEERYESGNIIDIKR